MSFVDKSAHTLQQNMRFQDALLAMMRAVQEMHKTSDLQDVVRVFWNQLIHMHIPVQGVAIHRILEPSERRWVETYRYGEQGPIGWPQCRKSTMLTKIWQAQDVIRFDDIDVENEVYADEIRERLGDLPIRSMVDVPFSKGVLSAHSTRLGAFDASSVYMLQEIAEGISTGFVRMEDMERLERQNQSLRESEDRFRQLASASYEGVVICEDGCIMDYNEQFLALLSRQKEDVLGQDILCFFDEDQRANVAQNFQMGVERSYEANLVKGDGTPFSAEIRGRFTVHNGKRVWVGAFRDLTERKALEDERIRTQRLRAVGELSAGVSHNLNNILTGILMPVQFLKQSVTNKRAQEDLDIVYHSAMRAKTLVEKLHESVRSSQTRLAPVNVKLVILEAVRASQPRWKDEMGMRGAMVQVETDLLDVPLVCGTESGLYDILMNLIFNAVDAMPNGGRILISTACVQDRVVVKVEDNGVGMNAAILERVFEPFFTTKVDVGSGLGLATVHATVLQWGGMVDVQSTEFKGTVFTLELPVWDGDNPDDASEVQPQDDISPTTRLLLVEDDEMVRNVLSQALSEICQLKTVTSGKEAIALFQSEAYDVVVIDLGLPDMPGDQVIKMMRENDPQVVTVLISGWRLDAKDARRAWFDFVVQKPIVDFKSFRNVLAQAIQKRQGV